MRSARWFSTAAVSLTLGLVAGCEATAVSTWETAAGNAALHPDSEQIAAGESLAELQIVDDVVMVVTRENDDVQVVDGAIHLKGDSAATSLLSASELLIEPPTVGRSSEEAWHLVNGAGHELFSAKPFLMQLDEEAWTLSLQFELGGSESAKVLDVTVAVQPYDENVEDDRHDFRTALVTADATPPSAPSNFASSSYPDSVKVMLSWTASTDNVGVAGYYIERCEGIGCTSFSPITFAITTTKTTYTDMGLTPSKTYTYRARAVDAAGNFSSYSPIATGLALGGETTPPSAPTNFGLSTVPNSTQIWMTWTASTDNVGVVGYFIERCEGSPCTSFSPLTPEPTTTTATTYIDVAPKPSTYYTYRVRAVDAAGNFSPYSPIGIGLSSSADTTAPSAPSGLLASAVSSSQINLSWNASTDNLGVVGYRLERCAGSSCTSFAQIDTPNTLSFSDTGLAAATSYRYRVRAVDAAGNLGAYSSIATATTASATGGDTSAPSTPSGLSLTTASQTQIYLSWTASADNVGVAGYRIERCTGSGCTAFAQIATSTSTVFGDSGLSVYTLYSYRVRAVDAAGNLSAYSNIATARTFDTTGPGTSVLSASAASTSQINLSWTAASDNVGIAGYRLERCTGAGCTSFALITTTTSTSFSNTGLSASTSYSYRVRAYDAEGNMGAQSNTATVVTKSTADTTAPTAPSGLSACAISASRIDLSWSASSDNVGVSGYRIERCTGSSCTSFVQIGTTTSRSFSSTGLSKYTTYRYRVRAVDAAGNLSGYSSMASATTLRN